MEREIIEKLDYIISILKPAHDIPDIIKIYLQHKTEYDFLDKTTADTYNDFVIFKNVIHDESDISVRMFNDIIKARYNLKITHTTKKGKQLYLWKRN